MSLEVKDEMYDEYRVMENLQYCCNSSCHPDACKHKLDLFLPQRSRSKKIPIVIFVHGGSWMRGDRRAYRHFFSYYDTNLPLALVLMYCDLYWNVGRAFARSGIACAVISYRLSKLEMPWVLFKLLFSLLLSTTLVLTPLLCITVFSVYFSSWLYPDSAGPAKDSGNLFYKSHSFTLVLFTVLAIISLCIVCIAVFQNGEGVFISAQDKLAPFLTSLGVSVICLVWLEIELHALLSCFSICLVLCTVYTFGSLQQSYRPTVRHPHHVEDVAASVRWIKTYGQQSKQFNPENIFLCGHSAGGHLVSLVATDNTYLRQVGLSPNDIKGVISISGVYNLSLLSSWFMERLLLKPVFGEEPDVRRAASPLFCLDEDNNYSTQKKIPFLVVNAEYDFFLKEDAKEFLLKLKQVEHPCQYYEVKGTNHFSIIFGFDSPTKDLTTEGLRPQLIETFCINFVRKLSYC